MKANIELLITTLLCATLLTTAALAILGLSAGKIMAAILLECASGALVSWWRELLR